jgi:quinoprotein glucose dehydrogenase
MIAWLGALMVLALPVRPADEPAVAAPAFKLSGDFEVQPCGPLVQPSAAFEAANRDELDAIYGPELRARLAGWTPGPDGYWYSFLDAARQRVLSPEDQQLAQSGDGMVIRVDADGSHGEIFCRGLRDPHGLAFDNLGNLFTTDAGSGQERQGRWLYLVPGGDYGWRPGWLHSALEPARVPWIGEKPWATRFDGQTASVLPPVANVPVGSWNVVHYPGTGFLPRYDDHFFISNPARKALLFWCMRPNGAGFLFLDEDAACRGATVRELAFRPGGRLQFITHSDTTTADAGHEACYELHVANFVPDAAAQEADRLLGGELKQKADVDFAGLLKHPDQRIRLAAEWRLATSTSPHAGHFLSDVALSPTGQPEPTIARLHAIWALGIIARRAENKTPGAGAKMLEPLVPLLEDDDLEVRSQAARVLGDLRVSSAYDSLIKMLRNPDERVSMFAAQALAKLGNRDALPQLLLMLRDAGDHDPNLRHAYVQALLGLRDFSALETAAGNDSAPVRMGALLAMRQSRRAEVARFLQDPEPALVLEAARAIHDENLSSALPQLASMIEHPTSGDALMCRVLNANFRVGEPANATALANFAARDDMPAPLRQDALNLLARWPKQPANDYVTGEPMNLAARDAAPARAALEAVWPKLGAVTDSKLRTAANQARQALQANSR